MDADYPAYLKHCIDGPILLFKRGHIDFEAQRTISIVGTRNVTSYGLNFCEELVAQLAPLNPTIVSGYAYGVDICAHKAAIKNGLQTIGCLAHGLNQTYPQSHARFNQDMEKKGGFVFKKFSRSGLRTPEFGNKTAFFFHILIEPCMAGVIGLVQSVGQTHDSVNRFSNGRL